MPTLDDAPLDEVNVVGAGEDQVDEVVEVWGQHVDDLLAAASLSKRIRVQSLGRRAEQILTDLEALVVRDRKIAEHEAALARLRRGED